MDIQHADVELPLNQDFVTVPPPREPLTPVEIELALTWLLNSVSSNQIALMRLRTAEMDAKIAYEEAHLIATRRADCPRVGRGPDEVTVGERESWIRHAVFQEYTCHEIAKKRVKNCREYIDALEQQCSLVQSMNKTVVATYHGSNGSSR